MTALGHALVGSPIGELTLVAGTQGLRGVYLPEHRRRPDVTSFGPAVGVEDLPVLRAAAAQLTDYFAGQRRSFDLPLDLGGSAFAQGVWRALRTIPYGDTWTYRELAEVVGGPRLVRAVAGANARNPVSVIVPCHRVIGTDGNLTGYAGGLDRKRFLLDLEARRSGLW